MTQYHIHCLIQTGNTVDSKVVVLEKWPQVRTCLQKLAEEAGLERFPVIEAVIKEQLHRKGNFKYSGKGTELFCLLLKCNNIPGQKEEPFSSNIKVESTWLLSVC